MAHALWIDISGGVPWRLADWSGDELIYLFSSHVCFRAYRTYAANTLYYVVSVGSRSETTERISSRIRDLRVLSC